MDLAASGRHVKAANNSAKAAIVKPGSLWVMMAALKQGANREDARHPLSGICTSVLDPEEPAHGFADQRCLGPPALVGAVAKRLRFVLMEP